MTDVLTLNNVTAGYGEAKVIEAVSLALPEGGGLAVLGRNGVGKSTLIQTIMGLTRGFGGNIAFRGADITRAAAHDRARRGLGWVPQERDIFASLSVEENLTVTARPGDRVVNVVQLQVEEHVRTSRQRFPDGGIAEAGVGLEAHLEDSDPRAEDVAERDELLPVGGVDRHGQPPESFLVHPLLIGRRRWRP
jgi:ABC-type sugar transport system ATPase subunit